MGPNLPSEMMRLCKGLRHVSIMPSITHTHFFMRFVLTIFLFFYVVVFFVFVLCLILNVACISALFILQCPHIGFLWRLLNVTYIISNLRCFTRTSVDVLSIPNSFCAVHQSSPDSSILTISITVPFANVLCVLSAFNLRDNCK